MLRAIANRPGPITLAQSGVASSVTGTTAETVLASVTIPGGIMGPNGVLRVSSLWSYTNNANSKTNSVKFGGTTFCTITGTGNASYNALTAIRNRNSQSSQVAMTPFLVADFGTSGSVVVTSAINTANDQLLTFTATLATATDTATLEAYTVEVLSA